MESILPVFAGLFPLAVMTLLILKYKVPIYLSILITLVIVLGIAGGYLGTPVGTLESSVSYGVIKGFWPIVLVIFAAIFAYNVMLRTGAISVIEKSLSAVTDDRRIQILLIAWCFGGFLEGAAGFSVSVAIPMGILLALGFEPMRAAVATLIADTVTTAFGAAGIPMIMLADLTNLSVTDLSSTVILQLAVFNFLLPVAMVSIVGGGLGAVKGILSLLIGIGITTTIPQYLTALLLGPQLVAFAGSLTSLAYLLLWLRIFEHKTPGEHRRFGKEKESTHELGFLRAGSIYLVMFVLILAASPLFPKIAGELAAVATPIRFTLDDERVLTANIDWIATPGVLILISTILGGLIQGAGPRIMGEVFARTAKQLAPAGVAICGIVAMATVMDVSGLIEKTAEPLIEAAGDRFAWISPLFGMLGTFVTGSVVNSNVLFGKLQLLAAHESGMSSVWFAAANAAGATVGKMVAPQSIAIAASASAVLAQSSSKMLSGTLRYAVAGAVILAAVAGLFAF